MRLFKFILAFSLIVGLYTIVAAQKKSASNINIFDDLPIDDPLANSYLLEHESAEEKIRNNIFINASLNKSRCYIGEPVLLTFSLYTSLQSTSQIVNRSTLFGFNITEMTTDNESVIRKRQGGKNYRVFAVQKAQLIPFKEGRLMIGPLSVKNDVVYEKGNSKNSHYYGTVSSSEISIFVDPLPEKGKPSGFSGLVGNFDIRVFSKFPHIAAGENNILNIEISGTGNISGLAVPLVSWPEGFESFSPKEKSIIDYNVFPSKGKRIFEIAFIATKEGRFIIPPVQLPFFDAAKQTYQTAKSAPVEINVSAALAKHPDNQPASPPQTSPAYNYYWFLLIPLILMIIAIAFYAGKTIKASNAARRAEEQRRMEILAAKEEKAHRLEMELTGLAQADYTLDYIVRFKKLLVDYLKERSGEPSNLEELLIEKVKLKDPELGEEVLQLFNQCALLLYAPGFLDDVTRQSLIGRFTSIVEKGNRLWG